MGIKSFIDKNEIIFNEDRKFGADVDYFPCYVKLRTGEIVPGLFTRSAIAEAIMRAKSNPEDIPARDET